MQHKPLQSMADCDGDVVLPPPCDEALESKLSVAQPCWRKRYCGLKYKDMGIAMQRSLLEMHELRELYFGTLKSIQAPVMQTLLPEIFRRCNVPLSPSRVQWLERELQLRNIPRSLEPAYILHLPEARIEMLELLSRGFDKVFPFDDVLSRGSCIEASRWTWKPRSEHNHDRQIMFHEDAVDCRIMGLRSKRTVHMMSATALEPCSELLQDLFQEEAAWFQSVATPIRNIINPMTGFTHPLAFY